MLASINPLLREELLSVAVSYAFFFSPSNRCTLAIAFAASLDD
jgi:hypothetical protein